MTIARLFAAASVALLGACGASSHDLSGIVTLRASISRNGQSCEGTGVNADIYASTTVLVTDSDGKIVAAGSLGPGTGDATSCSFPFHLTNVPDSPGYGISVAGRRPTNFTRRQIATSGWYVQVQES